MKPVSESVGERVSGCDITLATRFDETGHDEAWRNEVAAELNVALGQANDSPRDCAAAIVSLARRVADFEGIRRA